MIHKIKKLTASLFFAGLISGCNMTAKNEFEWGASKSGARGYPTKILSGTLYYKGEANRGHSIPRGAVGGGWGTGYSRSTSDKRPIPDRLEIIFYSYLENQTYRGKFDLPYKKLLELFQWGVENPKKMGNHYETIFNDIVIGIAPGGTVGVWLKGHGENREIFIGQAEKIELILDVVFQVPFRSPEEAEKFRVAVLQEELGTERLQQIEKEGIPFDIWQRYRQPYHWLVELSDSRLGNLHGISVRHINGENTRIDTPSYLTKNYLPIPARIFFRVAGEPYDFTFDDYETILAFEELNSIEDLTEEERIIHIEITPKVDQVTSTVRLYNAKHSIELQKTTFSP